MATNNPTCARSTRLCNPTPNPQESLVRLGNACHRHGNALATGPVAPDSDMEVIRENQESAWEDPVGLNVPDGETAASPTGWPNVDQQMLDDEFSPSHFPDYKQMFEDALSFEANAPPIPQRIQTVIEVLQNLDMDTWDLVGPLKKTFILLFITLEDSGEFNIYGTELTKPSDGMPYQLHEVLLNASQDLGNDAGSMSWNDQEEALKQYNV
ncbi:hypothetical protein DL96DRAFT_1724058 [Flagelloscypha sp. PMI_526]|nr:hypothetical protein DL96DRAFT_1724058 [Flagelloscypha sp. PMI_526]